MSHDVKNLLATTQAQVNPHPLHQIIQTTHFLQRIPQHPILLGAGEGERVLFTLHMPRQISQPLRAAPRGVHPNDTISWLTVPLPQQRRPRDLSFIDSEMAATGARVLEEEIEPGGEGFGEGFERLLFSDLSLARGLGLLELEGLESTGSSGGFSVRSAERGRRARVLLGGGEELRARRGEIGELQGTFRGFEI